MSEFNAPSSTPPPPGFDRGSAGSTPSLQPVRVDAGRGTAWWTEGWRLFALSPGMWIGIILLSVVISLMMGFIPFLGGLASTLLTPVFAGGIFVGCRALDRGGELIFNHLFACFSDHLGPLLIVGAFYLIGMLGIAFFIACGVVISAGIGGVSALFSGDPMEAGLGMLATFGTGAILFLLIGLLLAIPLLMALWFAPPLVVFRNAEPIAALKASFNANVVNMTPMLVYSVVGLVLAIVASIPLMLGWLVVAPMFVASVYASYKDIFGAPE